LKRLSVFNQEQTSSTFHLSGVTVDCLEGDGGCAFEVPLILTDKQYVVYSFICQMNYLFILFCIVAPGYSLPICYSCNRQVCVNWNPKRPGEYLYDSFIAGWLVVQVQLTEAPNSTFVAQLLHTYQGNSVPRNWTIASNNSASCGAAFYSGIWIFAGNISSSLPQPKCCDLYIEQNDTLYHQVNDILLSLDGKCYYLGEVQTHDCECQPVDNYAGPCTIVPGGCLCAELNIPVVVGIAVSCAIGLGLLVLTVCIIRKRVAIWKALIRGPIQNQVSVVDDKVYKNMQNEELTNTKN